MKQILANDLLTVTIDTFGAELQSIVDNRTSHEYLWHGDKAFWGRRSPVLFPLVGSVWNGMYRMDGEEYALGQHGFARDREFGIVACQDDAEAWFALDSDERTLALFPRRFRLEVGYRLHGERLTVMWRVRNTDNRSMPFQIGAHPAFNYPDFNAADGVHAYLGFDADKLHTQLISERGCVGREERDVIPDSDGLLPLTASTFDINTMIFADSQVRRVSMLDKNKAPYLSVLFNSPLVGIWSPSALAPFVCVEPWWGRCDRVGFTGEFADREYVNVVEAGQTFEASYTVIFDGI